MRLNREANLRRGYGIAGLTFRYSHWQAILAGGVRRDSADQRGAGHQENLTITCMVTEQLTWQAASAM